MIKKATFLCGLLLAATSLLSAQTQQGYVRTLERPDNVSVALEGVTVQVRGGHNAVVSGQDGLFRLPMDGKRNGDSYTLQQVQKNGFELADQGTLGRRYAYSDKVPLTVVMVSTKQLQADKQRIANNAYQTAERTYKRQLDILEKQLSDRAISEETYRTKLQELQQNLEHYQSLVEDLSDHYARTDYALLDKKEREVNLCIERGELEKADSLLATMFNPLGVLDRNREALAEADRRLAEGQTLMQQAQSDLAAVLRQQEKDAEYLYQLYTIALARFDNEKARQYIETRAALDTTNVDWMSDAGSFVYEYIADNESALDYWQRAANILSRQRADNSSLYYDISYNIALVYESMNQYDTAMAHLGKLLVDWQVINGGQQDGTVASIYCRMGSIYHTLGNDTMALDYHNKSLSIRENLTGRPMIAESYHNMAIIYSDRGDFEKAIDYCRKVIAIDKEENGTEDIYTPVFYDNLGVVFGRMEELDSALYYMQKALEMRERMFGKHHPSVAISYFNVGTIMKDIGNFAEAARYLEQAIAIEERVYGDNEPNVAVSYMGLGNLYKNFENRNLPKALNAYQKALKIYEDNFGGIHPKTAGALMQIGSVFFIMGEVDSALMLFNRILPVWEEKKGPYHRDMSVLYNNIANVYFRKKDYPRSLEWFLKALEVNRRVYGEEKPTTAKTNLYIGNVYKEMDDYEHAREYYNRALRVFEKVYGDEHGDTKRTKQLIREIENK